MLVNHYGVDLGTGGLIVQAQSRREILTDKFVALGLRPNRIKNRDLWDIVWLGQSKIKASALLLKTKLRDRNEAKLSFIEQMDFRVNSLLADPEVQEGFIKEMSRFLPLHIVRQTVESADFWMYLSNTINDEWMQLKRELSGMDGKPGFVM